CGCALLMLDSTGIELRFTSLSTTPSSIPIRQHPLRRQQCRHLLGREIFGLGIRKPASPRASRLLAPQAYSCRLCSLIRAMRRSRPPLHPPRLSPTCLRQARSKAQNPELKRALHGSVRGRTTAVCTSALEATSP